MANNRRDSAQPADSVLGYRQRLVIPIPGTAEMGKQVTAVELCEIASRILVEAPDPMTAVQRLKAEVDTWRLLPALPSPVEIQQGG